MSPPAETIPADDDVGWRALHVYYYDRDQDGLLLDAVRPFLADVADHVESAYVLRHWRRGPHVRVHVRTGQAAWERVIRPRANLIIGSYLREHPSTTALDPAAALDQHRALATAERERGPLLPWCPDNSIQAARCDSRGAVLGGEPAAALLADFYHETTGLLFEMLDHVRAGHDSKLGLAASLLLTVSGSALGGIPRSFVSFRAHAEGFLATCPDRASARAGFDRAYQHRRKALADRVGQVVATLDGSGALPPAPFVREWVAVIDEYRGRAASLLARELWKLPVPPLLTGSGSNPRSGTDSGTGTDRAGREDAGKDDLVSVSELYRLMLTSPAYREAVYANPEFHCHRVVLNLTYLHVTRLGLTPLDRFRTCHLVANAVEEVYQISALELVRRFVQNAG